MLKIGWYIQAVWSMRAVVLRKNLSKCVISPLMEHRRKAILLIPPSLRLPLPLFHFLFLPLFWVVSTLPPSFPPSPPLHAPWCLHFITSPPSINLSCFFFFFKEWLSSHTVLDRGAVIVVVWLPCGHYNGVCVCVCVCYLRAWLGWWSVWIWVKALVCVCPYSCFAAFSNYFDALYNGHAPTYIFSYWMYAHKYTYRPYVCALMPIFVCVTLSDLCLYLLLSLLRCQSDEQSWCEQWIETEQLHYQRSRCKKEKIKALGINGAAGKNGAALLMCKR